MVKTSTLFIGVFGIIVLGALVFSIFQLKDTPQNGSNDTITSFGECATRYPIIGTYPQECQTDEGLLFVQNLPEDELEEVKESITTHGRIVCLPHWNTTGPQTLECAFGLQDTFGDYYALRNNSNPAAIGQIPTNSLVTIVGVFVPGSLQQYQSIGTIEVDNVIGWNTTTDSQARMSFSYPEALAASTYIEAVDWPPAVQVTNDLFVCTEAGSEADRAGGSREIQIGDRTYCVTVITEGVAGSVYRQYAYTLPHENGTLTFTFSARFPQCDNYSELQRTMCEDEQTTFSPDGVMDVVAQSLE